MSFNVNNKLIFINRFQFLSSSLDSLVKNLNKDDFKYFSQEFDSKILDLVKQKEFYTYEYISDELMNIIFEKFQSKESLIVH